MKYVSLFFLIVMRRFQVENSVSLDLLEYLIPKNVPAEEQQVLTKRTNGRGFIMGVDKIVQLVAVIFAIVVGLIGEFQYSNQIIALLGIAGGWFVAGEDRSRFLIATIALIAVRGALGPIPVIGEYITLALGSLGDLFAAGAVTVIILGVVDRLKP